MDIQNTFSDIRNCFLDIQNNYFGYPKNGINVNSACHNNKKKHTRSVNFQSVKFHQIRSVFSDSAMSPHVKELLNSKMILTH